MDHWNFLYPSSPAGDVVDPDTLHVIVLSYDSYCRMRALLKRLEGIEEDTMKSKTVKALGGFVVPSRRTKLLFCRDVFEYPELEGHDLLCNHLGKDSFIIPSELVYSWLSLFSAPKLQGRPRKKKRRPDSESESSETSEDQKPRLKGKPGLTVKSKSLISGLNKSNSIMPSRYSNYHHHHNQQQQQLPHQIKNEFSTPALDRLIEVDFMSKLYKFMKDRDTPINRIPFIAHIQRKKTWWILRNIVLIRSLFFSVNVFDLFTRVQQLGGYEVVINRKLWRHLYEDLIGKHSPPVNSQTLQHNVNQLKKNYEK